MKLFLWIGYLFNMGAGNRRKRREEKAFARRKKNRSF